MEGCKRIKEGKKEMKIPFNSKLYFRDYDYSVAVRFPKLAEAVASPRQSVEIYKSFSVVKV